MAKCSVCKTSHAQSNGMCNSCNPGKQVRNPDQQAFAKSRGWGKKQEGGMPKKEN